MATTTTATNSFLQRLLGAMALDTAIYEEVEADTGATTQACAVVLLSMSSRSSLLIALFSAATASVADVF